MIGIAEVNYTPKVGLDLVGNYCGNDYASRGVHDSLFARAIVASDSKGLKVAVLSVDICFLSREPVEMMRKYISSQTGIKPDNIMIHATHTHSGPRSDLDAPEAKDYLTKAARDVVLANQCLKPSVLYIGRTKEERVSFNRRLNCLDGTTHMCWEKFKPGFVVGPWGPTDPELITLSIEQEGKPTGVIVNFGCHATTLTGNNWLYTADYPGYIVESIRRVKGKDFIPLFLNGPCGNVTQVDYRVGFPDTYQECQRIGYILGVSAMEAINNQKATCYINNSVHSYRSEDNAIVSLFFENAAIATVDTFFCIPDNSSKNILELYGSKGSIIAKGTIGQGDSGEMTTYLEEDNSGYDSNQIRKLSNGLIINPLPVNTYLSEIEEFSRAILEKRIPENNFAIGLQNQKILTAYYKSASCGKVINIK